MMAGLDSVDILGTHFLPKRANNGSEWSLSITARESTMDRFRTNPIFGAETERDCLFDRIDSSRTSGSTPFSSLRNKLRARQIGNATSYRSNEFIETECLRPFKKQTKWNGNGSDSHRGNRKNRNRRKRAQSVTTDLDKKWVPPQWVNEVELDHGYDFLAQKPLTRSPTRSPPKKRENDKRRRVGITQRNPPSIMIGTSILRESERE